MPEPEGKYGKKMIWKISLFLPITLLVTGLLAMWQQTINLSFEKIVLPQFAPTIGFLIIILIFKNLRVTIGMEFNKSMSLKSLIAVGLPFFLITIAYVIGNLFDLGPVINIWYSPFYSYMAFGIVLGSIGEELGWRSFLQPNLEKNISALWASVWVGLFWGLWHIGHYKNGFLFVTGFLAFTISASIILAWILRSTNYNIALSVLFHSSANFTFLVLFNNAQPQLMLINGIVWMVPAIWVILATGKDLTKAKEAQCPKMKLPATDFY